MHPSSRLGIVFALALGAQAAAVAPASAAAPKPVAPATPSHDPGPQAGPEDALRGVLNARGSFAFSDGSSVYTLYRDGRFELGPVGLSGRTIEGVWQSDDDHVFVVFGRWGWINGLSRDDDYRRMTFAVTAYPSVPPKDLPVQPGLAPALRPDPALTETYFVIEELVKIGKPELDRALSRGHTR